MNETKRNLATSVRASVPFFEETVKKKEKNAIDQQFLELLPSLQRLGIAVEDLLGGIQTAVDAEVPLTDKALGEINEVMALLKDLARDTSDVLATKNTDFRAYTVSSVEHLLQRTYECGLDHQERLVTGTCSPEASFLYLDIMDSVKRIAQETRHYLREGLSAGVLPSIRSLEKSVLRLSIIRRMVGVRFAGEVYLVGGALRELALGRTAKDYDFALECPEDLKAFERVFGSRSFLLGKKPIQTYRIAGGDISIDLTILEAGIKADLLRRDFTMNAMAFDIGRRAIVDPLNGWEDIKRRVIRYPRKESLKEDPLRMVKAIRHLAALGDFAITRELAAGIATERTLIRDVAAERIKYELRSYPPFQGGAQGDRGARGYGPPLRDIPRAPLPSRDGQGERPRAGISRPHARRLQVRGQGKAALPARREGNQARGLCLALSRPGQGRDILL